MVAHACHPSYAGSINRRITVQADLSVNVRPYLKKIPESKKGWGHSLSGRAPAWQALYVNTNPSTASQYK
jgi:hypothetical protein